MKQKKVCMLGAFGVGKTSMVARLLDDSFSEKYLTSMGVKIGTKTLNISGQDISLLLCDMAGQDEFHHIPESYLRGAAGYLLVMDGVRQVTLETALQLHDRMTAKLGPTPFVACINKADLHSDWTINETDIQSLVTRGWSVHRTSAKMGIGVREAFMDLAHRILQQLEPEQEES